MEEQFVARSRQLMEQIKALSDQLDAMDVANGRHCQPNPRFVDEDDVVTFSEARSQWRSVWFDTRSPRWATLTVIHEPQIYLSNPSYVEEEDEFVDEEFQEDEFVYEDFKHGDVHDDVKDPSQRLVDWDSPPTYDIDINDKDLMGGSLSYDQEKEFVVDWVSPLIYDIYPKKEEPLENVNLSDNIENIVDESSTYHWLDESPKSEVFYLDVNEVDFLGVENILSHSLDVNAFDGFYAENNFMFKSEEIVDSFWEILMAHEREKMYDNRVKLEFFESIAESFQFDHRSLVVISELFLVGCYIVLILKRRGWNGLIGHPKDRGKNHLNSRTNSLKPGENDAG